MVHARGYDARPFRAEEGDPAIFAGAIFNEEGVKVPTFTRFATVAATRVRPTARDVRGFATKFYTSEGNWDLVGNNIPVFFIQDAIKFPDLIHAA